LFFANAGGRGFYRSAYPADRYAELVKQVETGLKPTERISLIGDEWAQVRADKATVGDYLNLVSAVKSDENAEVVSTALSGVGSIYSRLAATKEEQDRLGAWIRETFSEEYAKLGAPAEGDSPNKRELRATLMRTLGGFGKDPKVIEQAKEIAEKYIADPASQDATLAQTATAIAAQHGDAALFDKLQHVFETSTDPEMQEASLAMLAMFQDPALEQRALDYALTDKVRKQDAAFQFAIALQSAETRDRAWQYVKDHWDGIHALLTPELGSALVGSTSTFCSADARQDVEQFFGGHKVASADKTLKHAVERINGCIEFRDLQQANLNKWLGAQGTVSGQ
jgi:aminopeptidase N/puromycin-sensitive aminopeptidase